MPPLCLHYAYTIPALMAACLTTICPCSVYDRAHAGPGGSSFLCGQMYKKGLAANSHAKSLLAFFFKTLQGQPKCDTWKDEWTVVTRDGGLAAQYEHTVLITPGGVEILTLP
eukprot:742859-Pelagomonas_calceolata.AAC.4